MARVFARGRTAGLAVAFALAPGCHDEGASGIEGEHVVVYSAPERSPCGGTLAHMDEFVAGLARAFAAPPPSDRIGFHWLTDPGVAARCDRDVLGCVVGGEVFAGQVPLNHELVHVVAAAIGTPPAFFREGLAVAYQGLGPDLFEIGWAPEEPDLRVLLTMSAPELADALGVYELLGGFSAFLIETHGLPAYLRMYGALAADAELAEVDAAFKAAFGGSFEAAVVAFEAEAAACPHQRFDAKLVECAAPELVWDGVSHSERLDRACEQDDAIGPYDQQLLFLRTITLPTTGRYELRMAGAGGPSTTLPDAAYPGGPTVGVSLVRCGGCGEGGWLTTREGDDPRAWTLPAGRYALRVHGRAEAPAEVGFSLTRVDDVPP